MKKQAGRRIGALILAALLISILTATAFAADRMDSFHNNTTIQIAASKWFCPWNAEDITITFENTGKKPVNVELPAGWGLTQSYTLYPGDFSSFILTKNNGTYTVKLSQNWFYRNHSTTATINIA